MAEKDNSKRLLSQKNKQRDFLLRTKENSNLNWAQLAQLLNLSGRTLADWKREKFLMSFDKAVILSKKFGVKLPRSRKLDRFWYVKKGAKLGGMALYKKYGCVGGNPKIRKEKWLDWWQNIGKFKKHPIINVRKPIKKPAKNIELAEFVGLMIGDGGITKNQVSITLNKKTDRDYAIYVQKLIYKLFGVKPSAYEDKKVLAIDIVVSRKELVDYCGRLGLKVGNKIKQRVDMPAWIKNSKKFTIACIRGLVDTDGCIINHRYRVDKKYYCYKKLSFTSYSRPLIRSVYLVLKGLGFNPRITYDGRDVRLDRKSEVSKYFRIIGTHNNKHKRRFLSKIR